MKLFPLNSIEKNSAFWLQEPQHGAAVPVDDQLLTRQIPGFTRLNEKARAKARQKFIDESETIKKACFPAFLCNTKRNLHHHEKRTPPQLPDFQVAAQTFRPVATLFAYAATGYRILGTILCALRCTALRQAEEGFRPVLSTPTAHPVLCNLFRDIVRAAVTKKKWSGHHCEVKRKAVLDYRVDPGDLAPHFQNFSKIVVPVKKSPRLTVPAPYTDTVAVMIGASSAQLREAAPYLDQAGLFLFGCGLDEGKAHRLSDAALSPYDPEIMQTLTRERDRVAALLRLWWASDAEGHWAKTICAEARASFGKTDSRYVSVVLDPKRLRDAIYYQVILSFLDMLEAEGILSSEDIASYRSGAKSVFDPDPEPEKVTRRIEEPEVFLSLMRNLVGTQQEKIAAENQPFCKSDKPFGAWRTISGIPYLIMPEDGWKSAYAKACRQAKELDSAFLSGERWERDLQKILCEADVIKAPSAGFRYRYDLFKTGKKDSTYVLAIPRSHLEDV